MTTTVPNGMLSFDGGALSGFRNRIINGDMRVAQRGSVTSTSAYTLDRWKVNTAGGGSVTTTQGLGAFTGTTLTKIMSIAGAVNVTDVGFLQCIESVNVQDLAGKNITVSFWTYQDTGSTVVPQVVIYRPTTTTDDFSSVTADSAAQTFSLPTATWTYVTKTFAVSSSATKGIELSVNGYGTLAAGKSILLTQVQLEVGSVSTPFEQRPIGTELALCQRYYEKSFDVGTAPAQANGLATGERCFPQPVAASSGTYCVHTTFAVTKRGPPTVTTYNPGAANAQIRNESAAADFSGTTVDNNLTTGFSVTGTTPGGTAVGNKCGFHWTASAEL